MHVPLSRHSNSWSSGITLSIGGWALHLGAVNVAFVAVTFIHVAAVVCIVALTASLPFRILIPTSNIGRINLLLHWCCIVGFKDCIQEFQVLSLYECLCLHMFSGVDMVAAFVKRCIPSVADFSTGNIRGCCIGDVL